MDFRDRLAGGATKKVVNIKIHPRSFDRITEFDFGFESNGTIAEVATKQYASGSNAGTHNQLIRLNDQTFAMVPFAAISKVVRFPPVFP